MNDEKFVEIEKISMEISSLARYGRTMEGVQEKSDIDDLLWVEVEKLIKIYGLS